MAHSARTRQRQDPNLQPGLPRSSWTTLTGTLRARAVNSRVPVPKALLPEVWGDSGRQLGSDAAPRQACHARVFTVLITAGALGRPRRWMAAPAWGHVQTVSARPPGMWSLPGGRLWLFCRLRRGQAGAGTLAWAKALSLFCSGGNWVQAKLGGGPTEDKDQLRCPFLASNPLRA